MLNGPQWFDDPFFREGAKQSEIDRVSMHRKTCSELQTARQPLPTNRRWHRRRPISGILIGSGVPIAFGTDSGVAGRFIGYFEHVEFDLMADAGLTPREILLSATSGACRLPGVRTMSAHSRPASGPTSSC